MKAGDCGSARAAGEVLGFDTGVGALSASGMKKRRRDFMVPMGERNGE